MSDANSRALLCSTPWRVRPQGISRRFGGRRRAQARLIPRPSRHLSHHFYDTVRRGGPRPLAAGGAVRTYTDITARKQVEKHIAHMARHDALTGLPNRVLLRERIDAALAGIGKQGT